MLKFISPHLKRKMAGFLMLGCEGGMMGYALYTSMFGNDALSTLMEVDLGNILFAFTFFIVLLKMANAEDKDTKKVLKDTLKTPLVSVVAIALILNILGVGRCLVSSEIGSVYTAAVNMLTSPVSALILMCVGYEMKMESSLMKAILTISGFRLCISIIITVILLTAGRSLITSDQLKAAVMIYCILPPQFITPIFIKDPQESSFAATVLSFYSLITITGYILLAAMVL